MKYSSINDSKKITAKDYYKKIIFNLSDFDNDGHLLQTVTIYPNTKQRKHYHNKQTEVFYILEGECEIYINDEKFISKPGDSFICSPGDVHWLWNKTDNEFKLVVFKINLAADDTVWME